MEQREYLAAVDRAYGDAATVEDVLRELAEQSAREHGEESPLHASMLSELGGYLRGAGRFRESEDCFLRAVDILRSAVGEDHPDYATALNNLAGTRRVMGKTEQAREDFLRCLDIYGETLGVGHVLYAACLNNLSLVALDTGELDQAVELMARAAAVLSIHPDCRDEYATAMANLAGLELKLGRSAEAEEHLLQARDIYENEVGTGTPHYYMILNSLGIARLQQGETVGAVGYLRQAAGEVERLYGPDHPERRKILRHLQIAQGGEEAP